MLKMFFKSSICIPSNLKFFPINSKRFNWFVSVNVGV